MDMITPEQFNERVKQCKEQLMPYLERLDEYVAEMELKWGKDDQVLKYVSLPIRNQFEQVRDDLNKAIARGKIEEAKELCERMAKGWQYVDEQATKAGYQHNFQGVLENETVQEVLKHFPGAKVVNLE